MMQKGVGHLQQADTHKRKTMNDDDSEDRINQFEEANARARLREIEKAEREFERRLVKSVRRITGAEAEEHVTLTKPVQELADEFIGLVRTSAEILLNELMGKTLVRRLRIHWHEGRVEKAVPNETEAQYLQRLEALALRLRQYPHGCLREFAEGFSTEVKTLLAKVGSQGT